MAAAPVKIPPKGYSQQRGVAPDAPPTASARCHRCGVEGHWSYECPADKAVAKPAAKLSRTQMLRLGLKQPVREVAPPKTEREIYDEQLVAAEAELIRQAKIEAEEQAEAEVRRREVVKRMREEEDRKPLLPTPSQHTSTAPFVPVVQRYLQPPPSVMAAHLRDAENPRPHGEVPSVDPPADVKKEETDESRVAVPVGSTPGLDQL